jgi:predicted restriction endonuclease
LNNATTLEFYEYKFKKLRTAPNAPHKYCMLLAVLDLARTGQLKENAIFYSPDLLDRFATYFAVVAGPRDHANPHYPFFALGGKLTDKSPSFWHLVAKTGRETILESLGTARSHRDILQNIEYAQLDATALSGGASRANTTHREKTSAGIPRNRLTSESDSSSATVADKFESVEHEKSF